MTRLVFTSNDLIESAIEKSTEMIVLEDLKCSIKPQDFDFIFFVDLRPFFPITRTLKTNAIITTGN